MNTNLLNKVKQGKYYCNICESYTLYYVEYIHGNSFSCFCNNIKLLITKKSNTLDSSFKYYIPNGFKVIYYSYNLNNNKTSVWFEGTHFTIDNFCPFESSKEKFKNIIKSHLLFT